MDGYDKNLESVQGCQEEIDEEELLKYWLTLADFATRIEK